MGRITTKQREASASPVVFYRFFSFRMPNIRRRMGAMMAGERRTTIFMAGTFLSVYVEAVNAILCRRSANGAGQKATHIKIFLEMPIT